MYSKLVEVIYQLGEHGIQQRVKYWHYVFFPTVDCQTDFFLTGLSPTINNFPDLNSYPELH